jgi:voltage-gated potassium channel
MVLGSFEVDGIKKVEKKIVFIMIMVVFIVVLGTATFMLLENQPFLEAVFYTLASAVGYGFQFSDRLTVIISAFIMIMEWACLWIGFDTLLDITSEGKVREIMGGMRMKKKINGLNRHCILCGYGRVGSAIAKDLKKYKSELVVIEKDSDRAKAALDRGYLVLQGDVLSEDTLKSAGAGKANILVASMGSDADNVFVTLTAKEINPKIKVIARAEREESMKKLKQAGATEVVMPSAIGGKAMAAVIMHRN